jgi:hypothetical protein
MNTKLSDSEFIERRRASARRRSERQRQRKAESGKVQVNTWLTASAKERLEALAIELHVSPSEVLTAAILSYRQPACPTVDAKPLSAALAERDAAMLALHLEGKSPRAIAAALAQKGFLTSCGTPLSHTTIIRALKTLL